MSDYYDSFDSFDSDSESESAEAAQEPRAREPQPPQFAQQATGHIAKEGISGPIPAPLMSVQWYGVGRGGEHLFPSDQDELESSTSSQPGK